VTAWANGSGVQVIRAEEWQRQQEVDVEIGREWHQWQAADSGHASAWFAAAFHLDRLLQADPANADCRNRELISSASLNGSRLVTEPAADGPDGVLQNAGVVVPLRPPEQLVARDRAVLREAAVEQRQGARQLIDDRDVRALRRARQRVEIDGNHLAPGRHQGLAAVAVLQWNHDDVGVSDPVRVHVAAQAV
jgi:hypothetical protein